MATTSFVEFLKQNPSIKHYTPTSPEFGSVKTAFRTLSYNPSAIARPQTADDVAALVKHCVATDTQFVVRTGGHDVHGRSTQPDILQIDMRDINYVDVDSSKETARIGGGILCNKLLEDLTPHGLMTPTASVGNVGYMGWATLGGYGPLATTLGLGVDQIFGAKVVNASGEVVDANERLLEGLRGGGGSLGIVVELRIKLYPAQEMQAGMIVFDPKSLSTTVTTALTNLTRLHETTPVPDNLDLQPIEVNIPDVGNVFGVCFAWFGSSSDQSKEWQEKISSLAPVMMSTIKTTSLMEYVSEVSSVVPSKVYAGNFQTVNLAGLSVSKSTIEILAKYAETMPPTGALICLHYLYGPSVKGQSLPGVFANRKPHQLVEISGLTATPEVADEGKTWVNQFAECIKKTEGLMEGTYISLTPKEDVDLKKIYGDRFERLLELKREFDPANVFKHTLPRLDI
ncbi:d-lactate dehydrogenase [Penicillium alfredii]|uniref:D-lactate dehydrogenase n=1 Tax=Penicillium alfredii TaxID=1506179 RepID=A0A9W9JTQ5_9EURO|nr:d-lactate dehydrogenase [Penicillium alfredii]KAJ5081478.1 d-lactate dehydrogenase [Penicillium alfredii]